MIYPKPSKLTPNQVLPVHSIGSKFSSFFPYLFNWIYSKREKINWKTETRYPLTARILWEKHQDRDQIIGVRFSSVTRYCMIDIDRKSPYHPYNSVANFEKVFAALADIGLYEFVKIRSSASDGIHLYFPLEREVGSFELACAVRKSLDNHRLEIANGVLECFPNTKAYNSEYNAHRLPLQDASYILDWNNNPFSNNVEKFVDMWESAALCQDFELLISTFSDAKKSYKANYKSNKKINDWQTELESIISEGWTGNGQTNDLLHKVCQYARVFLGFTDLQKMIDWAVHKATKLNGFNQFCSHKADLIRRVKEWSKYCFAHNYPMASKEGKEEIVAKAREAQREEALQRIRDASASISDRYGDKLTIRDLAANICKLAKCSQATLYKNLSLWHPEYKLSRVTQAYQEIQPDFVPNVDQSQDTEKQATSGVTQLAHEVLAPDSNPTKSSNFGASGFQPLASVATLMKSTKIKLLESQIAARQIGNINAEALLEIEKFKEEIRKLKE